LKVWIDLSNSPHPLLFAPVSRRLREQGHMVEITARDNAQTVELARERWSTVDVVGGESPGGRAAKLATIALRVRDLRRWAATVCPDVALSHNSYAQIVAARTGGIPSVTAMDFEHQPVNHLAFRLASKVILPELLPADTIRRQGAVTSKIVRYPGFKEELYIGDFDPDPAILDKVGITTRPEVVVVVRTPPSRAVYHPSENPVFERMLRTVCSQGSVVCVVLTRHPEQIAAIESLRLANCLIPREAIDSRSLIYEADALIGAGGTMTREAALMGIPTWTMFVGRTPAVDLALEQQGLISRLTCTEQLCSLTPRPSAPRTPAELRMRSGAIEQVFVNATLSFK
jgi:hypothetical protein